MIDFAQIRGMKQGQRDSFEELVCQLARRDPPAGSAEFRRVDGSGGDGGVEAYWLLKDGSEHGYQAKYFTRCGDIDWSQLDQSVSAALEQHPGLRRYTVALPCNLTDRSGKLGKGKTGWEHWAAHAEKWQALAKRLGLPEVKFVPWTESELIDRLASPDASGLRLFWFGIAEFTPSWFKHHVRNSVALLDERFHPEDHVDVDLQNLFRTMSRHPEVVAQLRTMVAKIGEFVIPTARLSELELPSDLPDAIGACQTSLLDIAEEFTLSADHPWHLKEWLKQIYDFQSEIGKLQRWQWEQEKGAEKEPTRRDALRILREDLSTVRDQLDDLKYFISRRYFAAEGDRFAIVEGAAGSGKSHLFGHEAESALKRSQPVVLLLGQQFSRGEPWEQIANLLGMPGTSADALLGALDAAAEAGKTLALLLIDGINEGVGSHFWRSHLAGFLAKIQDYTHVACILSCRSEYVPHTFPRELYDRAVRFTVTGFVTPEEQFNAARVYLDRRGIARPSTPWLAPEFVNPLFLRTTCLALFREGKREFPKGLQGTRAILAYYLLSVGRNLNAGRDGTSDLVDPTKQAVLGIANRMAELRQDFLSRGDAASIADSAFATFPPPEGKSWMDVLQLAGLFRLDPPPRDIESDPMAPNPNVVRFCFQRFQDHLMGQALLQGIDDPKAAFAPDSELAFVLSGTRVDWHWSGLFEALATLFPEKYAMEIIDALPGKFEDWWRSFASIFVESAKWRAHSAFTDRSLELLNQLPEGHEDRTALLIEVSVSAEHPWNAELVHKNLINKALPERDAFWTVQINGMSEEEGSPVGRLMDWCLVGQAAETAVENQRLAGIMLCWLFTASNRSIRDKATKALAALLLARAELFPELLGRFAAVNDLYVPERLLAAGLSACSLDQNGERAASYASSVFDHIFKSGKPPLSLLLRDYALGIVERASVLGQLPAGVDLGLCKPPYSSPKPSFRVNEEQLKKVAEQAGSDEILNSATGFMGDFAQYEIKSRVRSFLMVPLSAELPLDAKQKLAKFRQEVVDHDPGRRADFAAFERIANPYVAGILPTPFSKERMPSKRRIALWEAEVLKAERRFLELLSPAELARYKLEAADELMRRDAKTKKKAEKVEPRKVQRWVALRAYKLGWSHDRFPNDASSGMRHSRDRPRTERIGKKYQWLALDEVLCRLADNYWLEPDFGSLPRSYQSPHDVGFQRDVDPTILTPNLVEPSFGEETERWVGLPWIVLDQLTERELPAWPFAGESDIKLEDLITRIDEAGAKWTVLYEHQSAQKKYGESVGEHGLRQQEFRFIYSAQVRTNDIERFVAEVMKSKSMDGHTWQPGAYTNEQFLGEAPWRSNWPQRRWSIDTWGVPADVDVAFPVVEYCWESQLDASLPDGARSYIPSPWLARQVGLVPKPKTPGVWLGPTGVPAYISYSGARSNHCVLLDANTVDAISDEGTTSTIWFLIAERNAWPGGHNANAAWRRTEGICWGRDGKLRSVTWHEDNANGTSIDLLRGKKPAA